MSFFFFFTNVVPVSYSLHTDTPIGTGEQDVKLWNKFVAAEIVFHGAVVKES